ncbi:hypothetical protein N7539_004044 [Penicillium diatomitis]|uniref:pyridoxal 5'-phosphate synthase n=1 Tax=Penicillium diatomitis TaxID=2819901 RepID=A0A9W9XD96_9EURO|nr:uncharacterized protein N7539_004044 [Penicillium diatomitis]KAJ5489154.1 hypothetical protein N7539_004044 [Penicillium diatomitis]
MAPEGTGSDASSHRPKKLIFAPGDIDPENETSGATTQAQGQSKTLPADAVAPTAATDTTVVSKAARAHQFVTNPPLTVSQLHITDPFRQFHTWFRDPRLPASSAPETCTLATAELPSGRVSARPVYLKELDERGWVVYSNWGSREGKGAHIFGRETTAAADNRTTPDAIPEPGQDAAGGQETGNKWAALTFTWSLTERSVRIEGMLEPLRREESELYWRTRERGSQIGGWASWQSRVLWSAEPEQLATHQRQKGVTELQGSAGSMPGANVPADIDTTDIDDGRALLEQRIKEVEARFAGVEEIPLPPFWGGMRLVPESIEFWQGRRSRLHDRFRYVRIEGEGENAKWRLQRLSP